MVASAPRGGGGGGELRLLLWTVVDCGLWSDCGRLWTVRGSDLFRSDPGSYIIIFFSLHRSTTMQQAREREVALEARAQRLREELQRKKSTVRWLQRRLERHPSTRFWNNDYLAPAVAASPPWIPHPFQPLASLTAEQILRQPVSPHMRKTKIVCAIGPACRSKEMLGELLDAGMNVARLNFSHGTHEYHLESLSNLREAIKERQDRGQYCHCAILMDTKGPEIRTGLLRDHQPVTLTAGSTVTLSTDYSLLGHETLLTCSYQELATSVKPGDRILIADGEVTLTVLQCAPELGTVQARVENTYVVEEHKNVNLPGVKIRLPGITDKDRYDIEHFALVHKVDIVSGSFIRSAENVHALRACLGERGKHIRVHAKLESVEALANLDEILQAADGIHVSRGDLGMDLPLSKLALAQRFVIQAANAAGKPVVTSTQMLESMLSSPRPSNAECTDVANAVLNGTDWCVCVPV